MSVDRQDLARVVKQQQSGIAPQMWPIRISPAELGISLNSVVEVPIYPCDMLWMPTTYDKSYGVNPLQSVDLATFNFCVDPNVAGQNCSDSLDYSPTANPPQTAAVFGLRFNSPNNPWLLWGLSTLLFQRNFAGPAAASGSLLTPVGQGGCMRLICGPITRMWIQFYKWAGIGGGPNAIPASQIVLLSMLGFGQETSESTQSMRDDHLILEGLPPGIRQTSIAGNTYLTPQLNTNEHLAMVDREEARSRGES